MSLLLLLTSPTGAGTNYDRTVADTVSLSEASASVKRGPSQSLRPSSDLAGNWHGEDERTTNLYTSIDDAPFDDDTYIESPPSPGPTDYVDFDLPSVNDPTSSWGHLVRYRYGGDGVGTLVVELRQGTNVIASWSHLNPTTVALAEQALTPEQADAITDYADLRVRVRGD